MHVITFRDLIIFHHFTYVILTLFVNFLHSSSCRYTSLPYFHNLCSNLYRVWRIKWTKVKFCFVSCVFKSKQNFSKCVFCLY